MTCGPSSTEEVGVATALELVALAEVYTEEEELLVEEEELLVEEEELLVSVLELVVEVVVGVCEVDVIVVFSWVVVLAFAPT